MMSSNISKAGSRSSGFPINGNTATWNLDNVVCNPSNGLITVKVTVDNIDTNTGSITADNTQPTLNILKPEDNYIYLLNRRFIPWKNTLILGSLTVETETSDNYFVDHVEFYIDDTLKQTITGGPYEWYMNQKMTGQHELKIITYDSAGNKDTQVLDMKVFNLFGQK